MTVYAVVYVLMMITIPMGGGSSVAHRDGEASATIEDCAARAANKILAETPNLDTAGNLIAFNTYGCVPRFEEQVPEHKL